MPSEMQWSSKAATKPVRQECPKCTRSSGEGMAGPPATGTLLALPRNSSLVASGLDGVAAHLGDDSECVEDIAGVNDAAGVNACPPEVGDC